MKKHTLKNSIAVVFAVLASTSNAQQGKISDDVVKIGVLTDMSGGYSEFSGAGAVAAVKMAVDDFGGNVLGKPIEVVVADHQNKTDLASTKAREWFDTQKVDVIVDLTNSSVALAVSRLAKEKNKVAIVTGAMTERLTNEECSPNTVHYVADSYAFANGTGKAMVDQGGNTWFIVAADYAFGNLMLGRLSTTVTNSGGKVVGYVKHPLAASDFSSFMLQAQSSGARVIGLANAGVDTVNAMKSAQEFGITRGGKQNIVGLATVITDVHAMGLNIAQGLLLTTPFYWDMNDATRQFSKRYFSRVKKMPNMVQAGDYSAVTHYLKAVEAAGTDEAGAVMQKMREIPINDFFAKNGTIREDGHMVHDMYLMQVKTPAESKYPWDYYKLVKQLPASTVTISPEKSACRLFKQKS
ncbi:ABC transporter substrate-binding protein [Paraburkholderia caribensis]|uniref:ABC transporter permease n=1 Tax=Paraburkholderia caribensis TaxID=75105 RepID=A0A9Q6WPG1_9BURK|nr:ABC transporter substrate-binding protein [Paraburkholderia caribensis]MCO4878303.1 ABC transporter substrate-binding protein [Paraburkholderia caribensis]PTB28603.1 ABC transporter permease [Paraburkholderia caribensis]QLB66093.1 ABC transporter permease [Paraburkholderia caribensis]